MELYWTSLNLLLTKKNTYSLQILESVHFLQHLLIFPHLQLLTAFNKLDLGKNGILLYHGKFTGKKTYSLQIYRGKTGLVILSIFSLPTCWNPTLCQNEIVFHQFDGQLIKPGNTKGGSITVPLTSCLTGLDEPVLQIKTKIVSCGTADSKPVKQEVNGTVILPPLVFPDQTVPKLLV